MSVRGGEDSIVGYTNKRVANYTDDDYNSEYDSEDDFYDHYEPEDDFFDDDDDYQPFVPEEEEPPKLHVSPKFIKPCLLLNSPTKSPKKSPEKTPTWWDENKNIDDSNRIINGVLNYAALLPPPTPKTAPPSAPKTKKNKKVKNESAKDHKIQEKQQPKKPDEVIKPTRFCLSVIKKTKCFHGAQCRFAHDYSDLKECNFGEKCKKIIVVKTNPNGTLEMSNKNNALCNFKHAKESKNSYLKRVPQQHTSPKK